MFTYKTIQETEKILESNIEKGLTQQEVQKRQRENGTNQLQETKPKSMLQIFLEQLNAPLIYVLLVAAVISLFLKEGADALIIILVVFLNALVGMVQEGKAQRALDSLKKLTSPMAYVIRNGKEMEIPAKNLVKGDLVCLEAGVQVPADLRLVMTRNLVVEESALTGESLGVEKDASYCSKPLEKLQGVEGGTYKEPALGDRKNMGYMSTIVTGGRGMGLVTAIGMDTEIGKIATLINESPAEMTPLQKRLGQLGKGLSILALGLCSLFFLIAVFQGKEMSHMLLTAISLAVAAVPEGLPAVVTICLALSVTRMVKVNTIVRKLPSVETLGAVSVVCSDKTGTLTQNKMTVTHCFFQGKTFTDSQIQEKEAEELLRGMTLCNDAVLTYEEQMGDPTELALLEFSEKFRYSRQELEKTFPRIKELPFDSTRKMMSTFHQRENSTITYTKGAPDEIIKKCTHILIEGKSVPISALYRRMIQEAQKEMTSQALRTLALAKREGDREPIEEQMTFVGMVGMKDPARPEAAKAVKKFQKAGVTTVMITGDHKDTAFAIAHQLGIAEEMEQCITGTEMQQLSQSQWEEKLEKIRVFARVSPEHKVQIVQGFRKKGNVVAMTGDGVNDAPSLKAADVGIAMGKTGTDVAKQAAHMILTDDNFATIEKAMEEGRSVYENIKKSVIFLLSSNLGEMMTMFLAVLMGFPAPLKSSHILWVNLITDSLPALALGMDKNEKEMLMKRPPRKSGDSLFAEGGFSCTCFYGVLIAAISLAAFFLVPYGVLKGQQMEISLENLHRILEHEKILQQAQTYAFTVLGMSQLFHAIGMRNVRKSVIFYHHKENKMMIVAFFLGLLLQISVTWQPVLRDLFQTDYLTVGEWIHLLIFAVFPLLSHEILVVLAKISKK